MKDDGLWPPMSEPQAPDVATLEARIASLQASLDDAHREVSRLCGEKHARDTAARVAIEALEGPYRQGETGGA